MKQDAGQKVQIIATGQTVETTGLMLGMGDGEWKVEIKYKNGFKDWFYTYEFRYISNSK